MELVARATYSPKGRRPTAAQVEAWQEFLRAHAAAQRAVEARLAGTGLSLAEYDVLFTIGSGPHEGLRPKELADRVLITKSGLTRLVDRLVEAGSAERRACPGDRRGQLVALTARGRRAARRASPAAARAIAAFLADVSDTELAAFARSCDRITKAAAEMTA